MNIYYISILSMISALSTLLANYLEYIWDAATGTADLKEEVFSFTP